jgi:hypothetical protein
MLDRIEHHENPSSRFPLAECQHRHVVGAQQRLMTALPARHRERPHAVGAHVAEGHGRPGLGSWSGAHAGEDILTGRTVEAVPDAAGCRTFVGICH